MQIQDFEFFNIETYTSIDKSEKLQELFGVPFYREENTNKYSNFFKKKMVSPKPETKISWWVWIIALVLAIAAIWGLVKIIAAIGAMII